MRFSWYPLPEALAGGAEASTLQLGCSCGGVHLSTVEHEMMLADKTESQQGLVWQGLASQEDFVALGVQD